MVCTCCAMWCQAELPRSTEHSIRILLFLMKSHLFCRSCTTRKTCPVRSDALCRVKIPPHSEFTSDAAARHCSVWVELHKVVPRNISLCETPRSVFNIWYQGHPVSHLHFPFWAKHNAKYWSESALWIFITCLSNKLRGSSQFPCLALLLCAEVLVSLWPGGSKSIRSAVSWGTAVSAHWAFLPVWDLLTHSDWFTTPYALFGISPQYISTQSDNLILLSLPVGNCCFSLITLTVSVALTRFWCDRSKLSFYSCSILCSLDALRGVEMRMTRQPEQYFYFLSVTQ